MLGYLWKGICIGLLFGLPAGAVGALTVQRTLAFGPRAGIVTGLGSSAADCLYASAGAFGLTFLSDFLLRYQSFVHLAGGVLLLLMGAQMLRSRGATAAREQKTANMARAFASSFAIGITNPAAILTFLFAFSWFGIAGPLQAADGGLLVLGVLCGTLIWWFVLAGATTALRSRCGARLPQALNPVFGTILILLGALILGKNRLG